MATYKTTRVSTPQPIRAGQGVIQVSATYTVATALALNDIIEMVNVPNGARILEVILVADDLDTGGSPTIALEAGDGGDTDRFIKASNIGQAGGVARMDNPAGGGYKYTANDTIDIKVSTGPATGATSVNVTLTAFYTLDTFGTT